MDNAVAIFTMMLTVGLVLTFGTGVYCCLNAIEQRRIRKDSPKTLYVSFWWEGILDGVKFFVIGIFLFVMLIPVAKVCEITNCL